MITARRSLLLWDRLPAVRPARQRVAISIGQIPASSVGVAAAARALLASLATLAGLVAHAAPERVAVAAAANFVYALDALNAAYRQREPNVLLTSATGASGSLFAQIQNGAPFDVFLSGDADFPARLVRDGLGEAESLQTFATGRLVLWTTRADLALDSVTDAVRDRRVRKIAIAQPKIAPYGRAAHRVLERLDLLTAARPQLVVGESISQTAQFVETGNADVGFVAMSLVRSPRLTTKGRWIEVPAELYEDVDLAHAAVLTNRGAANRAARRYLAFLRSSAAQKILADYGYAVPAAAVQKQ